MKEVTITDFKGISIGQVENIAAGTGCSVFLCKDGMRAGLDVRGGGPASRESKLLDPLMAADVIHAVVLAGGSSYGLEASNGVMKCLEERNIGFEVGVTKVPLVVQSDLFDLTVANASIRPDIDMGYRACEMALDNPNYRDGNYGAGCGCTVGKILGMDYCMKTGIGSYAVELGELFVGAVVAVNAYGDIYDWKNGKQIAGVLSEDKKGFRSTAEIMKSHTNTVENRFVENTTLGVIITNAQFSKSALCKIAGMAHDGYARAINPVHTSCDGDSIYALSSGNVKSDMDLVGTLAAEVIAEAIKKATINAESAYGYKAYSEIK